MSELDKLRKGFLDCALYIALCPIYCIYIVKKGEILN